MMTIENLTTFLGYCTVINMAMLLFATVVLVLFSEPVKKIHSALTKVNHDQLPELYFQFLGNFKLAILVFNLTPYLALILMS